jgi:transposase
MKHSIKNRAVVQYLASKGHRPSSIAKILGVNRDFVYRWKDREDVGRLAGSGRPPKLDRQTLRAIERKLTSKARPGQRQVGRELGLSQRTVGRGAKMLGLKPYRVIPKPPLNSSQQRKRVRFAMEHKDQDWDEVVFEDEKTFIVGREPNKKNDVVYAYRPSDVEFVPKVRHPPKLNVAAAIFKGGRSELNIFSGNMTAVKFASILEDTVLPAAEEYYEDGSFKLIMDSDPKHTSRAARDVLDQRGVDYVSRDDWPANSPDLNPIENVWSMLVDALNKNPPSTVRQLRSRLKAEWKKLAQSKINNAIDSMPERLKLVREAKGKAILY